VIGGSLIFINFRTKIGGLRKKLDNTQHWKNLQGKKVHEFLKKNSKLLKLLEQGKSISHHLGPINCC
jgi:hypothetical protein